MGRSQNRVAVAPQQLVVAEADGEFVAVGQRGRVGEEPVVQKLYVHHAHRDRGLGSRLLQPLSDQLPDDAERLWIEHFAANTRAGAFYEREGFTVERVEASATHEPTMDQVWRARPLTGASHRRPICEASRLDRMTIV